MFIIVLDYGDVVSVLVILWVKTYHSSENVVFIYMGLKITYILLEWNDIA